MMMELDDADLVLLVELLEDEEDDPTMEQLRGADYHDIQDWQDGTGRWDRKGIPHDKRLWRKEAHKLPSRTFSSWFRPECRLLPAGIIRLLSNVKG